MGCGFSSTVPPVAAPQHGPGGLPYRVPVAASAASGAPDGTTTMRPRPSDGGDHVPGYMCDCDEPARTSTLSASALSALQCRPTTKRAHHASCWVRQWVLEARHAIEPDTYPAADAVEDDSKDSYDDDDDDDGAAFSPAEGFFATPPAPSSPPPDDVAPRRLSRAAVMEHTLRLAASADDEDSTW